MYARVSGSTVAETGTPPTPFWDGAGWVPWSEGMGNWYYVAPVDKPADTPTQIYEASLAVQSGKPVMVWNARPRTAEELAEVTSIDNKRTIEEALNTHLTELQTLIDTLNSTINSNPAQAIKILARGQRRIVRLLLRQFDSST